MLNKKTNKEGGEKTVELLEIFEKVNLIIPIEQRKFFNYFEDTVEELESMYSGFVVEKDAEFTPPSSLSETTVVLPLYKSAIVDNIIFLNTGEEARKSEFIRKSREAYLKYWCDNAKCKKIKGRKW